jgi:hypothetical protein
MFRARREKVTFALGGKVATVHVDLLTTFETSNYVAFVKNSIVVA